MENQFVAVFIASDLLLFFYLPLLYALCLDILLFPVSMAFCSPGIFLFILPSPASFPSSIPRNPSGPHSPLGPQALALPLLCTSCFMLGCLPFSSLVCYMHCWCHLHCFCHPPGPSSCTWGLSQYSGWQADRLNSSRVTAVGKQIIS